MSCITKSVAGRHQPRLGMWWSSSVLMLAQFMVQYYRQWAVRSPPRVASPVPRPATGVMKSFNLTAPRDSSEPTGRARIAAPALRRGIAERARGCKSNPRA